jgi:tRNA nucleotidyltransferase (CCA-adding enzyme)
MIRFEYGAGVIVFLVPKEHAEERRYLLLQNRTGWDFPKGHLNENEDEITAAFRELQEETGITDIKLEEGFKYKLKLKAKSGGGDIIRKDVILFLGSTATERVALSDEHLDFAYLLHAEALERLKDKSKRALQAAEKFLTTNVPLHPRTPHDEAF